MKNSDTAGSESYEAGKKSSAIKRHIGVDTLGLPHAIAVTTAEVTDRIVGIAGSAARQGQSEQGAERVCRIQSMAPPSTAISAPVI
ncbi:MAG: hypothetical protein HYZ65_15555 [Burkholderiales bacterium]|nr:hypothetical protein [Burkholderiales bacterium]